MNCPNCSTELSKIKKNDIELDMCPNCNGIWFDAWEWEQLMKNYKLSDKIQNIINEAELANVDEKLKFCPICNRGMQKLKLNDVVFDRCYRCGGSWFDSSEATKILSYFKQ